MFDNRFTLPDALVALLFLVLALNFIAACGEQVSSAEHRDANMTQIRDIHRGLVSYSQMNNDHYAGISGVTGKRVNAIDASDESMYGMTSPTNNDISAVYAILLTNGYVTPESVISPLDAEQKQPAPKLPAKHSINHHNYSYAVLRFGSDTGNQGRRSEWRATSNSQAPVVGDRSRKIDSSLRTTGLHNSDTSGDSANWRGFVGWNDNHVTFETSGVFEAGSVKIGDSLVPESDDLFSDVDGGVPHDRNAVFSYR